jgi:hypothetical protein
VFDDPLYEQLLGTFREQFEQRVENPQHLFTTDAIGLFDLYLDRLPPEQRQHHNCHACRQFVERFGGVVTISALGKIDPVMWGPVPSFYAKAHAAVRERVVHAKVNGVFLNSLKLWGTPVTDEWTHLHVRPPKRFVYHRTKLKNAGQAMAEKREEYRMLVCGLVDFPANVVDQAVTILKAEALYRSEKCLGVAEWLAQLHAKRAGCRGQKRVNVTWLAVASAPAGYCHVRSSMIGTLLEDLAAGMSFDQVKRRFADKMHPLQYQRPQAAPKAGNIARAEKVVAELESAGALERRYARLSEVETIWKPRRSWKPSVIHHSVFDHLKGDSPIELPSVTMTWEKFARTVLPDARKIDVMVPQHGHYIALCTAVNKDAPPVLQWDDEKRRNPVSWYVYTSGSPASQWNLEAGRYAEVSGISLLPPMWYKPERYRHQGAGAILIVKGCRDARTAGLALFPEILRSEYREIRSTIEAHSRSRKMEGAGRASACGFDLRKGSSIWYCKVRVTSADKVAHYVLDRWD